jgi:hypothetical protein
MLRPAFVSWRVVMVGSGSFEELDSNGTRSQAFASLWWRSRRAVAVFDIYADRWQHKHGVSLTLRIIYLTCLAESFENFTVDVATD